jgi:hypothetical protein
LRKDALPGGLFKSGTGLAADPELEEARISYKDTLSDLDKVRAVEIRSNQKRWLVRTESSGKAALAVGLRPPLAQNIRILPYPHLLVLGF